MISAVIYGAFGGAFLVLCLAGIPAARAGSYNFVTVDYGQGYETFLYGINNNGFLTGLAINPNTELSTGVMFNGGAGTLVVAPVPSILSSIRATMPAKLPSPTSVQTISITPPSTPVRAPPGAIFPTCRVTRKTWPAASTTTGWSWATRSSIPASSAVWDGPGTGVATRSSAPGVGPHDAGDSDLQHQRRRTERRLFPG